MRKLVYVCDKCGKTLSDKEIHALRLYKIDYTTKPERSEYVPWANYLQTMHFCSDCAKKLLEGILPGQKKATDPEPKKEPAVESRRTNKKKEIDIGKARALKNAGWSYEKIGDELGVTGMTVRKYLIREARKDGTEEADGAGNLQSAGAD